MSFNKLVPIDLLAVSADATSPTGAGYQVTTPALGFAKYKALKFIADITGGANGTLDVIVEHSSDGTNWYEYARFPQVAAGVSKSYSYAPAPTDVMKQVGKNNLTGSTLGTTIVLAQGDSAAGPWMDQLRIRYVAGAGTTLGAAQAIKVIGVNELYS